MARDDDGLAALDEGLAQRVLPVDVGDLQRAVAAAKGVVAAQSLLAAPEVGQAVGIAPAAVAALRPAVEIHALAAVVVVAVDRAGAEDRKSTRLNSSH